MLTPKRQQELEVISKEINDAIMQDADLFEDCINRQPKLPEVTAGLLEVVTQLYSKYDLNPPECTFDDIRKMLVQEWNHYANDSVERLPVIRNRLVGFGTVGENVKVDKDMHRIGELLTIAILKYTENQRKER